MPTPSELVTDAFGLAQSYAANAQSKLTEFLDTLNQNVTSTPLIDLSFSPVAEPGAAAPPIYMPPGEYSSSLTDSVRTILAARLLGGTGIAVDVEAAIWDRARERELAAWQGNVDQLARDTESLGWDLPPGILFDGVAREQRTYYDKVAGLSRDIAIKQADLEQTNAKTAIDQVMTVEQALGDIWFKRSSVYTDAYKADIDRYRAEIEQDVKHWETSIKQYEAQINYTLNGQKINADIIRANSATLLDASKVGAQVYAQLTAAAYSLIHASASVSAGATNSVSYSYSNDTATAPTSVTAV